MAKRATSSEITAPKEISDLVDKFAEHHESYKRSGYNETLLRRDFLDLFFEALGWDMTNRKGYAEAYRDVIHEDALRVEKAARAPDYCFRIGGTRKFFVEAKKPAVDIKTDVSPAFQLRRYAWTAKLPLSILTDFEEFAVYDCRKRPDKSDKASEARILLLNYTDYLTRWDEIADVFSREAILKGSFDKFAESTKKKRGTAPVDEEFLKEIDQWREELAKNLSLRNESLTDRQLNVAVGRIIDRIIFLRMCEGRGIEEYGRLLTLLNGERVYRRLVELFYRADERYNSGLFHFQSERGREQPDELTPDLKLDDKVLKDIIRRLYYPESPYEFAALPADILGQVYEQFLGKVIRLTAGHRAKIEEKPEVRKAGGVYYTPTYIVDYIVENTVGKLLEGKTPQEVGGLTATFKPAKNARPISILDPACGSGSFLLVAYQYLLDWYLKQYTEVDDPKQHARGTNPRIYQTSTGDWRLTIAERKRILLSHIYGVDIDYQAVEVTKLSLLLKVLEKETEATIQRELFAKQRALPDLAENIKCGNSLIGPDFYDGQQRELFTDDDRLRINAFDWRGKQGFPKIFNADSPGFDAVIGNPPYISAMLLSSSLHPDVKEYWKHHYSCARGAYDIYILFIEKAANLVRQKGFVCFIVPNKFLAAEYAQAFRSWVLARLTFVRLLDLSRVRVWSAAVYPVVPLFQNTTSSSTDVLDVLNSDVAHKQKSIAKITAKQLAKCPDNLWSFITQTGAELLIKCISRSVPLESLAEVCGATTVAEGAEYPSLISNLSSTEAIDDGNSKFLVSGSVFRYYTTWEHDPVQFTGIKYRRPVIRLTNPMPERRIRQSTSSKIIICKVALVPRAYFDETGDFTGGYTTYIMGAELDPKYITGVINSKLMAYLYRRMYDALAMGGGYLRFQPPQMRRLPIIAMTSETRPNAERLSSLVQQIQNLHMTRHSVRTDHERTALQHQIDHTDRQIDALVYELYGLSDKEIQLIEDSTK